VDVSVLVSTLWLSVFGTAFGWHILRRIDRLEARVDALPTREEFNALVGRVDRIEREVAALRADLTEIALAVCARTRPQTG
jgi:hypothetical protein